MPKRSNTRGAQGDGSIRKRKDGRWEARYTLGVDPGTGKQIQRSIYGKTQDEVRKKLKQATADVDKGVYTEPSKLTVGAWLDIWADEYNANVKPSTLDQYKYQIRVHLKPCLGAVKLTDLTAPMVQKFYNDRRKPYQLKQRDSKCRVKTAQSDGLSPKSINNLHNVFHKALDKAVKLGFIPANVCDAVTLPKVERAEIHPVTDDHIPALLEAIKGNPYEDVFFVTAFTGLRESEVLGLTWDCVDFDTGMITVYRQLQKDRGVGAQYRFTPLKNDKPRTFMAAPAVISVLKRIKKKQAESKRQLGSKWQNEEDLIFTNEFGGHLSKNTVYNNFKRCAEKAGVPETRFHDLRHTYATLALQQGVNIKTVSSNLGHATVSFTLDVYGHVSDQMQKDSADKMQGFLDGLSSKKSG